MLCKIELLVLLKNDNGAAVTAYFYDRNSQNLLRYFFSDWDALLGGSAKVMEMLQQQKSRAILVELDLAKKIGSVLTSEKTAVTKTYVNLATALIYAQMHCLPIFISEKTVQKHGLPITKQLIAKILQC